MVEVVSGEIDQYWQYPGHVSRRIDQWMHCPAPESADSNGVR